LADLRQLRIDRRGPAADLPVAEAGIEVEALVPKVPGRIGAVGAQPRVCEKAKEILTVKALLILNDPPYGTECCYNALRLAHALAASDSAAQVVVFLMADAVVAARKGQKTPAGYYNMEHMLKRLMVEKAQVLLCGTCMDARGMVEEDVIDGAKRSTLDVLATETLAADRILVF
jgi:uncharacterized protein involved in oxidation of intracellular sulfur